METAAGRRANRPLGPTWNLILFSLKFTHCPLPKLPVPAVKDTLKRYLRSVRPLLNDQEYADMESLDQKIFLKTF